MHVVVVGGGLAGLTAACHLAEQGVDVEIFESNANVGGRVRSETVEGFTLDRGFQVLFPAYPAVQRELDVEALELQPFGRGVTLARQNHRSSLVDPTERLRGIVPTVFNRDITVRDLLAGYKLKRHITNSELPTPEEDEQSIRTFLQEWGFSPKFITAVAIPFFGGMTLDQSLESSEFILKYILHMLVSGSAAVPAAGMGAIPRQLQTRATNAGTTIRTSRTVTDVRVENDKLTVEVRKTALGDSQSQVQAGNELVFPDAVVVATEPQSASSLLDTPLPTDGVGSTTVHVSLPSHQRLDTGKYLLLNAENTQPVLIAPMSTVAPQYAPGDEQLLSAVFLGDLEQSDQALGEAVQSALTDWYPEHSFGGLSVLGVERIPFAQIRSPPGFSTDRPAINAPKGPVYLAGDYLQWSSIQSALDSGKQAAETCMSDFSVGPYA